MSEQIVLPTVNRLEVLHDTLFEEIQLLRNGDINVIRARATASLAKHIIQLYALQLTANQCFGNKDASGESERNS